MINFASNVKKLNRMKTYVTVISILLIPLLLIVIYGTSDVSFPTEDLALQKVDFSKFKGVLNHNDSIISDDTLQVDTVKRVEVDTTKQRILFFGDSMLEGLGLRMCDYAKENDYEFTSVCWYSSSSEIWAKTDTLQYFIDKTRPTFAMICLCSNEQFVRDLDARAKYIDTIIARLGDIPFIWISPPSWKEDTGINSLIRKRIGEKRYFDSTRLQFTRGKDHVHPTFASAEVWMDSVAVWMQSLDTNHPIRMNVPAEKRKRVWNGYYLQPYHLSL